MHLLHHLCRALFTAALCPLLLACSSFSSGPGEADSPRVARVGEEIITLAELNDWIKEDFLRELEQTQSPAEIYEVRSTSLARMIDEQLLEAKAKERGLSVIELLDQEMGTIPPVTEEETRQFYVENSHRMGGATYEQIEPNLRAYIAAQRDNAFRDTYVRSLREESGVTLFLEPPRIHVTATGASFGPNDAPVTIVEFSDYQCPYCKRAEPTLWRVVEAFPDEVRWVYRHFPLTAIHPNAISAAEAAVCANQQGRFWQLHRIIFNNTEDLQLESLQRYAEEAGLDPEQFAACMDSEEAAAVVQADMRAGEEAGVSGTPAFFINGIPLSGAMPFERFEAIIREELTRLAALEAS